MGVRFTATLDAAKPVFRSYFRPLEQVELRYPISRGHTTVENVMRRLGLLEGTALKREIRAGNLEIGRKAVTSPSQRVYPGNELSWQELSIFIVLDLNRKSMPRLLYEQIRTGGPGRYQARHAHEWRTKAIIRPNSGHTRRGLKKDSGFCQK